MSARVVTRAISSDSEKACRSILKTLNGDDDATDHSNLKVIIDIRRTMYQSGTTLVVRLIELSRALASNTFDVAVGEIRAAHGAMFKNLDFRMDPDMLNDDRRTALKAEHIATRKHPFVVKALEVTAALAAAGFGKTIDDFDARFIALPFRLLGEEIVGCARAAGTLGELPELLRGVHVTGRKIYEAAMQPEIDADQLFDSVTAMLDHILRNTRGCKRAVKLVQSAKNLFRSNMVNYLREGQVQGNPMVIIEMLILDVQKSAADGDKVPFTEFAVLLKELRKASNKAVKQGGRNEKTDGLNKVLDSVGELLESVSSAEGLSGEELLARSAASRAQLSEALSQLSFE